MIVGKKEIDYSELKSACASPDKLVQFADGLVPTPLRHLREIRDNQRYLVALQVRNIQSFSWKKKQVLCEALLQDVRVKGVVDVLYDYTDLLRVIDREAFTRYLKEDRTDVEG